MARILVVDDEEALRTFMARALSGDGHETFQAGDGLEALARLAEQPVDLLISDIVMPELDGLALALKVAKDHPATSIILVSGYPDELRRAYNLEALVAAIIAKPFSVEDLRAKAREVLAGG